ncbi:MAG TPA: hypothetical protein VFL04_06585 [Rectinemataceae bacterium]|nr:hypothetical protein [Rectinemataceae bacterium]
MRWAWLVLALVLVLVSLSGCAPGPNELQGPTDSRGRLPGFWQGLWNGAIAPVTFIVSLFTDRVQPYEVHNSGRWYNFGYILGLSIAFGGGAGGAAARRRRA